MSDFIRVERVRGGIAYLRKSAILGVSENENLRTEIDVTMNIDNQTACYIVRQSVEEVMNLINGETE